MPEDTRFVQFVARRYHHLAAYRSVALGLAVLAAAPLLTAKAWETREWTLLATVAGGLVAVQVGLGRYYAREFGLVTWLAAEKRQPWYVVIGIWLLESGARGLGKPGWESGLVTLGLAAVLAFHALGDRRFRTYSFLAPALVAYLGIDRLTASFGMETWIWLQRAAVLFAGALIVIGLADHFLLLRALSADRRRLALSVVPAPLGHGLPAQVRDPIGATMLSALEVTDEADVTFLSNIAGLRREEGRAWLESLKSAGLVWIDDRQRSGRDVSFVRLSVDGHDVARRLWV